MAVLQVGSWNAGKKKLYFLWFHSAFERTTDYSESLHDALFTDYCIVPLTIPFPQKARQVLKILVSFIWKPSNLWFWKPSFITLHSHSILVFLCFFSYNKLVLFSEYICTYKTPFACTPNWHGSSSCDTWSFASFTDTFCLWRTETGVKVIWNLLWIKRRN